MSSASSGVLWVSDVVSWRSAQLFVDDLLPALRVSGLEINPAKCKLLCVRGPRHIALHFNGFKLLPLDEGEPIMVMNLPVGTKATESKEDHGALDRQSQTKILQHPPYPLFRGSLAKRVAVLKEVVYGSIRWVAGNFQDQCVRRMMGVKRASGETGVDIEVKERRAMVFDMKERRWGGHLHGGVLGVHRTQKGFENIQWSQGSCRVTVAWCGGNKSVPNQPESTHTHKHTSLPLPHELREADIPSSWRAADANRQPCMDLKCGVEFRQTKSESASDSLRHG